MLGKDTFADKLILPSKLGSLIPRTQLFFFIFFPLTLTSPQFQHMYQLSFLVLNDYE